MRSSTQVGSVRIMLVLKYLLNPNEYSQAGSENWPAITPLGAQRESASWRRWNILTWVNCASSVTCRSMLENGKRRLFTAGVKVPQYRSMEMPMLPTLVLRPRYCSDMQEACIVTRHVDRRFGLC